MWYVANLLLWLIRKEMSSFRATLTFQITHIGVNISPTFTLGNPCILETYKYPTEIGLKWLAYLKFWLETPLHLLHHCVHALPQHTLHPWGLELLWSVYELNTVCHHAGHQVYRVPLEVPKICKINKVVAMSECPNQNILPLLLIKLVLR